MPNNNYVKGECRHCADHLEFPAAAAGETIPCPHCGQPTELVAPVSANKNKGFRPLWLVLAIAVGILLIGTAVLFFVKKQSIAAPASASDIPNAAAAVPTASVGSQQTNDFSIAPIALEKTPGSSLVYATGNIRNVSSRRRFGVKIVVGLLDASGRAIGQAQDYQALIESGAQWHFRALVLENQAASAQLNSISEDR